MFLSYRNQKLIFRANQLAGLYMMETLVIKELKIFLVPIFVTVSH